MLQADDELVCFADVVGSGHARNGDDNFGGRSPASVAGASLLDDQVSTVVPRRAVGVSKDGCDEHERENTHEGDVSDVASHELT